MFNHWDALTVSDLSGLYHEGRPRPNEPTEIDAPAETQAPEMGRRNFNPEEVREEARRLIEELRERSRRTGENFDVLLGDTLDRLNREDPIFAIMLRAQLNLLQINAPARGGAPSEPFDEVASPMEQLDAKLAELGRAGNSGDVRERVQALVDDMKAGNYPMSHPDAREKAMDILARAAREGLPVDGLNLAFTIALAQSGGNNLVQDQLDNARMYQDFAPVGEQAEIADGVQLTLNADGTYTIEVTPARLGQDPSVYYKEPGTGAADWRALETGQAANVSSGTLFQIDGGDYVHLAGPPDDYDSHMSLIDPADWGQNQTGQDPELLKAQFMDRLNQILRMESLTAVPKAELARRVFREMAERGLTASDDGFLSQVNAAIDEHLMGSSAERDAFRKEFLDGILGLDEGPDSKSLDGAEGNDKPGTNGKSSDTIAALAAERGITWEQASQAMDIASIIAGHLGQKELAAGLKIGVAGGNFYQNQSFDTGFALASALAASGMFGDDAARFAGYADTGMKVGSMLTNFSSSTALAGVGALSQFIPMGMNERRFLNTGLAAAGFALAPNPVSLAMLMSTIVMNWGQNDPKYRDLGEIDANGDGTMEALFYQNPNGGRSGQYEYRFADIETGPPIAGFVGELLEMDGQFFLGGGFTTEQLNAFTGAGLATLDNSIVIGDRAILRRGSEGPGIPIDEATYRHLLALNGGSSQLVLGVGSNLFETVAPFTEELQSGAIFRQNAHHGIHSMMDIGGGEMMGSAASPMIWKASATRSSPPISIRSTRASTNSATRRTRCCSRRCGCRRCRSPLPIRTWRAGWASSRRRRSTTSRSISSGRCRRTCSTSTPISRPIRTSSRRWAPT